jgi:hypothetical protein
MFKRVQLDWIAEAEARDVSAFAMTQHAISEPAICVVPTDGDAPRRHRWRALVALLARRSGNQSECSAGPSLRLVHPSTRRHRANPVP